MIEHSSTLLDNLSSAGTNSEIDKALDPLNMMGLVLKFPDQCREAAGLTWSYFPGHTENMQIRNIVITGVGGSAIGGDFIRVLADEYGTAPIIVNRDYTLPNWVGPSTLLLAASYSGNTEETLAAYSAATSKAAQIAAVTSGGQLARLAEIDGRPLSIVPGGQPPRSATGYLFFPMLTYLSHHGLIARDFTEDISETLNCLEGIRASMGPEVPTERNPAKQLALSLYGKLPIIYGSYGYCGAAAYRWKSQFNENTKVAAFANVFPEQNHNEILAWVLATRQTENWAVVFLRDPQEATKLPRITRRVEVTKELIQRVDVDTHEVYAQGESLLSRMMSVVYIADFVTVYTAYLYKICPTDIGSIDHLKAELSKIA